MRFAVSTERTRESSWQLLLLLGPLCLTLLLYWPTISQPYFWDDVIHFDFATTRSFLQIWTDVRGLSYYRPLTFTLYKILFETLPQGKTAVPHLFLLLVHAANAWLVGNLLRRTLLSRTGPAGSGTAWAWGLTTGQMAGLLAAMLFVVYPFAVLPVSHFAAFMHPLVTFFLLATTLSALLFVTDGRPLWILATAGFALFAPFVHESGVMAGPVAAAVLVLHNRSLVKSHWRLMLLLVCASLLFLPAWWLVPKTPNTFEWTGWGGILASTLFFAQGPTYPVQPLSRSSMDYLAQVAQGVTTPSIIGMPIRDLAVIGMMSLGALILAGLALWRARWLRILSISLAWTALVTLPSIIVLPFPYVSVSQRLLYSSAPAATMLWASVCVSLAGHARRPGVRAAVAAGLAILLAAVPVLYVQREIVLHELALQPLEQLAATARQHPDRQHLVVNAVNWINYKKPWYALGQEGVSVSANYVDFERLVQINSGNEARFAAVTYPAIKTELARHYYSTIHEETPWDAATFAARAQKFDQVWLTVYGGQAIKVLEAGAIRVGHGAGAGVPEYLANFDGKALLLHAELEIQGQTATARLRWRYLADLGDVTVFRHLRDCAGKLIGQGDGDALAGMLRWDGLTPGTELQDVRHITPKVIREDGCYVLGVGLYSADGQRVPVWGPDQVSFPDATVSLTFASGQSP